MRKLRSQRSEVGGATVRDALDQAIERLAAAGVETPRVDAELLLAHALGLRRLDLHAYPERRLTPDEAGRWERLLRRREAREPVPYLTGRVEFFGLPFRVGPGALIPRPETEILVEAVLDRACGASWPEGRPQILDVGTGTGCIALALASRLPTARVVGLEPSPEALAIARENGVALGLQWRVTWVEGRWEQWIAAAELQDLIVANPPYIPSKEVERLAPEQREYEPRLALDGGPDGLALITSLLREAPRRLRPGGLLALEIGAGQSEALVRLACQLPEWRRIEQLPDLAGIPRVLVAWRGE